MRHTTMRQTVGSSFDPRANSFNALRVGLALLVFVQHGWAAGGFGLIRLGRVDPGTLAVDCFFVISGFLVTRSWLSLRSTGRFLWHRFLRIMPGFWVCLAIVALVLAPLGWLGEHGSLSGYFTSGPHGPLQYMTANSLLVIQVADIAGTPANVPLAHAASGALIAWNGSLWTLFWEACCYLGVAVLGLLGILRRRPALVAALAGGLWALAVLRWLAPDHLPALATGELAGGAARLGPLFLAGALLHLYGPRIPLSPWLAAGAAVVSAIGVLLPDPHVLISFPLAYLCLWAAIRLPIRRVGARPDLSYGLYIYTAPVQQLLAGYGLNRHGVILYFAGSLLGGVLLATASWYLVERPALGLKNLRPTRLVRGPRTGRGGRLAMGSPAARTTGPGRERPLPVPGQRRREDQDRPVGRVGAGPGDRADDPLNERR